MALDISTLMPEDTPGCMKPAWLGLVHFALREKDIREVFMKDTGIIMRQPRNGFEAMIDEVSGYNDYVVREFVLWVNKNLWGPVN
jgi:hypothetical protein